MGAGFIDAHPSIRIRRAVLEDARSISAVLYATFAEYEPLYSPEAFRATTPSPEQIEERMEAGPIWVAIKANNVVGTVSAIRDGDALYIRSMAVLPGSRGQGIGRRLLAAVEEYALQNDHPRLWLSTTPFLIQAIHLYKQFGFLISEEGPRELFGTPLFTMIKDIRYMAKKTEHGPTI